RFPPHTQISCLEEAHADRVFLMQQAIMMEAGMVFGVRYVSSPAKYRNPVVLRKHCNFFRNETNCSIIPA
ncbi:MAG: hypothetical protein NTV22_02850, partial [bacterium]|nr:hypothetical protein [bacterium]